MSAHTWAELEGNNALEKKRGWQTRIKKRFCQGLKEEMEQDFRHGAISCKIESRREHQATGKKIGKSVTNADL